MLKAILATVLAAGVVVLCEDNNYVCEGKYKIDSVQKCDNPEQYKFDISITKKKINRTHDGFAMTCDLPEDFSLDFGMTANVYSKGDGGYRLTDTYNYASLCGIINQLIKVEFERLMAMAGYSPPNCPVPKSFLEVKDYVLDKNNIPNQSKCGQFKNDIYILEGDTKVGCITAYTTVSPIEDEEDNEDD